MLANLSVSGALVESIHMLAQDGKVAVLAFQLFAQLGNYQVDVVTCAFRPIITRWCKT